MKQVDDFFTIDMLPSGAKRGRPKTGQALTAAQRKAKSRAAKISTHDTFTISLPLDVANGLRDYLKFKDITQGELFEKLVRSQLLRKR